MVVRAPDIGGKVTYIGKYKVHTGHSGIVSGIDKTKSNTVRYSIICSCGKSLLLRRGDLSLEGSDAVRGV